MLQLCKTPMETHLDQLQSMSLIGKKLKWKYPSLFQRGILRWFCSSFLIEHIQTIKLSHQSANGRLSLAKSSADSQEDVNNGGPLLLNLTFPLQNPLPKITDIYVNGTMICANSDSEFKQF